MGRHHGKFRQTALAGADFDTWLSTLQVRWSPAQIEVVRHAYALAASRNWRWPTCWPTCAWITKWSLPRCCTNRLRPGRSSRLWLRRNSGPAVARLVDGIAKLDAIGELHQSGQHVGHQLESLRKMLLAMAQDVRVVLIKLAMRLHELRQFGQHPAAEQCRIAQETWISLPRWPTDWASAASSGRWKIWRCATRSRRLTSKSPPPSTSAAPTGKLYRPGCGELRDRLRQVGIRAEVSGRVKHIYGIWRKMQLKKLSFEQIFDVRAVRVMVDTVNDCYAALGVVHACWNHIHQSSTTISPIPSPTVINRCTRRWWDRKVGPGSADSDLAMHQNAELGVAAHWRYKEGGESPGETAEQQIAWLRQILEYREKAATAICWSISRPRRSRIGYAITPKGAIVELAQERHRWISPTTSIPKSVIAVGAPRSTAASCRSLTNSRMASKWTC